MNKAQKPIPPQPSTAAGHQSSPTSTTTSSSSTEKSNGVNKPTNGVHSHIPAAAGGRSQQHKSAHHHNHHRNNNNKATKKEGDINEYRKAFEFFDANNDGFITARELENAMRKCGVHPSKLELRIVMSQADKDHNGVITFDEFVQLMRQQEELGGGASEDGLLGANCNKTLSRLDEMQLRQQFRMFDKDDDGFIELREMTQLVRELALTSNFPVEIVRQLFQEADVDGDGRISFDEFVMAVV